MLDVMVWLQQFRNPVLDVIVEAITITAEENVLLIAICLLYWCINKKMGYVVGLAVVLSNNVSSFLKDIFKIERPWVLDDRIIPIRKHTATGYSFPSGHTLSGTSLWASIALCVKKKKFTVLAIIMMLLIAVSRVYLSVHTPLDVGIALILAVGIAFLAYAMITALQDKGIYWGILLLYIVLIGSLFFIKTETHYKMSGVLLSFLPSYLIEKKYIRFNVKGKWWKQALKVIIGIAVALGIRLGLGAVFPEMLIFDFIRYFLMGMGILVAAPWLFVRLKLSASTKS